MPSVATPLLPNTQQDSESHQQLLKKQLKQAAPLMLRGIFTAVRYTANTVMAARIHQQLLAPLTLINQLESVYIVFACRSLGIVSTEISQLSGKISKAKDEIEAITNNLPIEISSQHSDDDQHLAALTLKTIAELEDLILKITTDLAATSATISSPSTADEETDSTETSPTANTGVQFDASPDSNQLLKEKIQALNVLVTKLETQIGITYRHGFLLGLALSTPITGLYFVNDRILALAGQHPFAVEHAKKYFESAAPGFLPLILLTAQQRLLQGLHEPTPVLVSNIIHSLVAIAASAYFLFGGTNRSDDAMHSIGQGFVIAGWTALFTNTLYFLCKKSLAPYHVFSLRGGVQGSLLLHLAAKGIPGGVLTAIENLASMVNSIFLGLRNLEALTADQVASQIALLFSIMNGGLGQATSVCIGKAYGEKKPIAAKRYGNMSMLIGMTPPFLTFFLMLAFSHHVVSLFLSAKDENNRDVVSLANHFVQFECLRQIATASQFTASFSLLGLKDTAFTMKTSVGFSFALNLCILSLMHFAGNVSTLALFLSKMIGVGAAAFSNSLRWITLSHELSDADKADIKNKSGFNRTGRGLRLFFGCNKQPTPSLPAPTDIDQDYTAPQLRQAHSTA